MKLKRFEREANQSSIDLKDREKHNTQNEEKHYVPMQRRKENVITYKSLGQTNKKQNGERDRYFNTDDTNGENRE